MAEGASAWRGREGGATVGVTTGGQNSEKAEPQLVTLLQAEVVGRVVVETAPTKTNYIIKSREHRDRGQTKTVPKEKSQQNNTKRKWPISFFKFKCAPT